MKKKNLFFILSVIFILVIIGLVLINNSLNKSTITITQYKAGTSFKLKNINIKDESDIKELSKYVEELKPLSSTEQVALMLPREIVIKYNDDIIIGIQLGEKGYCHYINKKENISELSRMPEGLYEWVVEKL